MNKFIKSRCFDFSSQKQIKPFGFAKKNKSLFYNYLNLSHLDQRQLCGCADEFILKYTTRSQFRQLFIEESHHFYISSPS